MLHVLGDFCNQDPKGHFRGHELVRGSPGPLIAKMTPIGRSPTDRRWESRRTEAGLGLQQPLQEGIQGGPKLGPARAITQDPVGHTRSGDFNLCAGESLEGFKLRKNLIRLCLKGSVSGWLPLGGQMGTGEQTDREKKALTSGWETNRVRTRLAAGIVQGVLRDQVDAIGRANNLPVEWLREVRTGSKRVLHRFLP